MLETNAGVVLLADSASGRTAAPHRLATEIRLAGYTCQVINYISFFTNDEISDFLQRCIGPNTKILGISTTFMSDGIDILDENKWVQPVIYDKRSLLVNIVESLSKVARRINHTIKVVVGGSDVMAFADNSAVDTLITGYGDQSLVNYLKYLDNKNPFLQFRVVNGKVIIESDLRFDFSNCQIKYVKSDNVRVGEILPIEISRGCIFNCNFCADPLNGKKKNEYNKSFSSLREEYIRNYNEYGITSYRYMEGTHNDNSEKLMLLAQVVQSLPFKLDYVCYLRLDLLHRKPEQYSYLRDGGLLSCIFGIESLHHPSLRAVRKGLNPDSLVDELYRFSKELPAVGTHGNFICGLPFETKESMQIWSDRVSEPSFPLDSVRISPLHIKVNSKSIYLSDFDKDSSEHYTWDDATTWNNGNFNRRWAVEFCGKVFKSTNSSGRQKVAGWSSYSLMNVGYSSDVIKTPVSLYKSGFPAEFQKMVDNYKITLAQNS